MNTPDATTAAAGSALSAEVCVAVAHLLQETLQAEPPAHRGRRLTSGRARMPIGNYLLAYGYIRPQQLIQALARQQQARAHGAPQMLGDVLVAAGAISARVLATMLTLQLVDRLIEPVALPLARLGERLVLQGRIQPAQLTAAIQLQTWLRAQGLQVALGAILVEQNAVTRRDIETALQAETLADYGRGGCRPMPTARA